MDNNDERNKRYAFLRSKLLNLRTAVAFNKIETIEKQIIEVVNEMRKIEEERKREQEIEINKEKEKTETKEEKILRLCNPQEIAKEIMSRLEKEAVECKKAGKHKAGIFYPTWAVDPSFDYKSGPFVNESDKNELTEMLFEMVKKYVSNKNIKLELALFEKIGNMMRGGIGAELSW